MLYLEEGQIFDDQYQLIKLIDTGGFAEVWKARNINAENIVALKIYQRMDEQGADALKAEYNRLFELQHSYLLNALHFGKFKGFPYLEMRFFLGGSASERINLVDETEIARCMGQVAGALNYLHQNNIVHQDIKPNNILLDQKGNYYLADLGLSVKLRNTLLNFTHSKTQDLSSSQTGTTPFAYRAPELYDRYRTDTTPLKETDIWAFGATIYEILTGEPPFGELGGIIQNTDPFIKPLPNKFSSNLYDIISSCLEKDITKRPTAAKLEKEAIKFLKFGSWADDNYEEVKTNKTVENAFIQSKKELLDNFDPINVPTKKELLDNFDPIAFPTKKKLLNNFDPIAVPNFELTEISDKLRTTDIKIVPSVKKKWGIRKEILTVLIIFIVGLLLVAHSCNAHGFYERETNTPSSVGGAIIFNSPKISDIIYRVLALGSQEKLGHRKIRMSKKVPVTQSLSNRIYESRYVNYENDKKRPNKSIPAAILR